MLSYSKSSVRVETRDRFFGSESSEFSSSEPLYQRRFLTDKPKKELGIRKIRSWSRMPSDGCFRSSATSSLFPFSPKTWSREHLFSFQTVYCNCLQLITALSYSFLTIFHIGQGLALFEAIPFDEFQMVFIYEKVTQSGKTHSWYLHRPVGSYCSPQFLIWRSHFSSSPRNLSLYLTHTRTYAPLPTV